jgi:hypothetical protein
MEGRLTMFNVQMTLHDAHRMRYEAQSKLAALSKEARLAKLLKLSR